jgi:5-methyltetrahydrofolate--homocysteine methyltransferase
MASVSTRDLVDAITGIREEEAVTIVDDLLTAGTDPRAIVESCREAMTIIGARFEAGEAFIPELIMAGEIMSGISASVRPHLGDAGIPGRLGRVVLGTVKGDIHDIGKDIVASLLEAGGFEVVDLGVNVAPGRFVETIREQAPCTVALSCLLTTGFDSMKATVAAVDEAGMRSKAKVMIGGAPITADVCEYVGADGWGDDAATAVRLATRWADGGGA